MIRWFKRDRLITDHTQSCVNSYRHRLHKSFKVTESYEDTVNRLLVETVGKKHLKITQKQRRRQIFGKLWRKRPRRCHYCGERLSRRTATIDHVIPTARGGKNILDNLVLSCAPCNCEKGSLTDTEYIFIKKFSTLIPKTS